MIETKIKQIADELGGRFSQVKPHGRPDELAMPYGNGYSGIMGHFRTGDYENLKEIVEYVKQNIPQSEWRKGMNLIARERKQCFNVRPNPLYVAMQEAEAVLRGYQERQEMLKDKTDYSEYPKEIRPIIPTGLAVYAFEKIQGLIGLVSVLNDNSIKPMHLKSILTQNQTRKNKEN